MDFSIFSILLSPPESKEKEMKVFIGIYFPNESGWPVRLGHVSAVGKMNQISVYVSDSVGSRGVTRFDCGLCSFQSLSSTD